MSRLARAAALVLLALPGAAAAQTVCPGPGAAGAAADTVTACGPSDPLPNLAATSSMAASALGFDFSVDPYSLVSTSVSFSQNTSQQRLGISPLKLRTDPNAWNDWTVGVVTGGSSTTFSTGLTYDQAAAYGSRRRTAIDEFNTSPHLADFRRTEPPRGENESLADYQKRIAAGLARVYSRYWMERFRNTTAITATGAVQTFGSSIASRVDMDDDGKIDNAHTLRSYGATVQLLHRLDFWTASTLTAGAAKRRTSAVEGTPLRNTYAAGLSVSRVVFLLDPNYLSSKDYRSKLYVPSLAVGASLDWQECRGTPLECDDRLVSRWSLMPYLDTRLPGGAQFRLGIPVRRDRLGDQKGVRVAPVLQFGWSLASL